MLVCRVLVGYYEAISHTTGLNYKELPKIPGTDLPYHSRCVEVVGML